MARRDNERVRPFVCGLATPGLDSRLFPPLAGLSSFLVRCVGPVVATFCAGGDGTVTIRGNGLPGPGAIVLPMTETLLVSSGP